MDQPLWHLPLGRKRSGCTDMRRMEGNFAGAISCLRYHLAICREGLRVPLHSNLVTVLIRRQGCAFRQCRKTRQQLHESDGAVACSHPGMRPLGVVARANDNRPLLGLVAFTASKRTSILVAWCHCNEVNNRPSGTALHLPSRRIFNLISPRNKYSTVRDTQRTRPPNPRHEAKSCPPNTTSH